ncbi:MAG: hypothetical protein NTX88_11690 [Candidatus Atribacteria bacterium]|nr:hypothetical protein [Candidatus Atribacteria bacterium]
MPISKYVLVFFIFFALVFLKDTILTYYWLPFSGFSLLSSLIFFLYISEKKWIICLFTCLLSGVVWDVFSFSPFGIHLFLAIFLFGITSLWVSLFSTSQPSIVGYFLVVPVLEEMVMFFFHYLGKTVWISQVLDIFIAAISILVNFLFFYFLKTIVPVKETGDVE